jgi:hypothetical protein
VFVCVCVCVCVCVQVCIYVSISNCVCVCVCGLRFVLVVGRRGVLRACWQDHELFPPLVHVRFFFFRSPVFLPFFTLTGASLDLKVSLFERSPATSDLLFLTAPLFYAPGHASSDWFRSNCSPSKSIVHFCWFISRRLAVEAKNAAFIVHVDDVAYPGWS